MKKKHGLKKHGPNKHGLKKIWSWSNLIRLDQTLKTCFRKNWKKDMVLKNMVLKKHGPNKHGLKKNMVLKKAICEQFGTDFQSCLHSNIPTSLTNDQNYYSG